MTSPHTFLVIGATAKTGRRVAERLRALDQHVRTVSRGSSPSFDWDDETTWAGAVEGASVAFVVPPPTGDPGTLRAFADVAAAANVRRVVLISTPEVDGSVPPLTAESQIVQAGIALTALRLRWFDQNFSEDFLHPHVMAGDIRVPAGEGREAFVDADDIADVAVTAMLGDGEGDRVIEVAGPRLLSFADVAADLSAATGREVRYTPVTRAQFLEEETQRGAPPEWAEMFADMYGVIASGALASTTDDVERMLGRPARDFRDYATNAHANGAWEPTA